MLALAKVSCVREILGPRRGDSEDCCLMGCDTVQSGRNVHTFLETAGFAETSESFVVWTEATLYFSALA